MVEICQRQCMSRQRIHFVLAFHARCPQNFYASALFDLYAPVVPMQLLYGQMLPWRQRLANLWLVYLADLAGSGSMQVCLCTCMYGRSWTIGRQHLNSFTAVQTCVCLAWLVWAVQIMSLLPAVVSWIPTPLLSILFALDLCVQFGELCVPQNSA